MIFSRYLILRGEKIIPARDFNSADICKTKNYMSVPNWVPTGLRVHIDYEENFYFDDIP